MVFDLLISPFLALLSDPALVSPCALTEPLAALAPSAAAEAPRVAEPSFFAMAFLDFLALLGFSPPSAALAAWISSCFSFFSFFLAAYAAAFSLRSSSGVDLPQLELVPVELLYGLVRVLLGVKLDETKP